MDRLLTIFIIMGHAKVMANDVREGTGQLLRLHRVAFLTHSHCPPRAHAVWQCQPHLLVLKYGATETAQLAVHFCNIIQMLISTTEISN